MTEERRRQLEALLAADRHEQDSSVSMISLICARCVSELVVSGAGATVLSHVDDGENQATRRGLVHATDAVSTGLEDLQLTVGEGPCLDAFTSGGPVQMADLAQAATRWPAFSPKAGELGAAAVFSFPLQVGAIRLGSLDCYRDRPGRLSHVAVTDGLVLADLATRAILTELDGHAMSDWGWLDDPYVEVHQATGMVQVQLATTTETALLRLRAHAYTYDLPLTEVARRVVTRELCFSTDPDPLW